MARGQPGKETYTPQVQPEDLPRKIIPRDEGVTAAPAFAEAAEASENKYRADSATWAGNQLAQFRQQSIQSLDAAKQAVPAGQDPEGFADKYLQSFDKQAAAFSSNQAIQSNPYASRMLDNGISELRASLQTHTLEWQ